MSTRSVLAGYLAEQARVVAAGDLALRRGDRSVIHQTRVATRKMRSAVRTFAELFDGSRADALDSELRWFAGLLGEVRDRQVLRGRLAAMTSGLDEAIVLAPIRARVETTLRAEERTYWDELHAALGQPRYLSLLAEISGWVERPPWAESPHSCGAIARASVGKSQRRVARRLRRALADDDVAGLHDARKAAKRARYANEALAPAIRAGARKRARHYQSLQELLGEHQDSLVSAELLRRLGAEAAADETGFAFGVLFEREMHNAHLARSEARRRASTYY